MKAHIFVFILLSSCFLASKELVAQVLKKDSLLTVAKDSLKSEKPQKKAYYTFSSLRAGVDLFSLAKGLMDPKYDSYVGELELNFQTHHFLHFTGGFQSQKRSDDTSYFYQSKGLFLTSAYQRNLIYGKSRTDCAFFGAGLGFSSFSHDILVKRTDPIWGYYEKTNAASGQWGSWAEIGLGIKVNLRKGFYFSYDFHFRQRLLTSKVDGMKINDFAGFGSNSRGGHFGFRYSLLFDFSGDAPEPPAPRPKKEKKEKK